MEPSSLSSFSKRKSQTLAAISSPLPDKSPKGNLDAAIVPLVDAINRHPSFFTTSSCSGRISILSHPNKETSTNNSKKKARGGGWVFVTHDPADPAVVADLLFGSQLCGEGDLVFRFEPLIVAVECADLGAAQTLVAAAVSCGFRESGITSVQRRIMVAIRCSIRLEVPLGQVGLIMVSQEYTRYLVGISNEKMEANKKRTGVLLHFLQDKVLSFATVSNKIGECWKPEKGHLLEQEAKQSGPLLEEMASLENHSQVTIVDYVKNTFDSEIAAQFSEHKSIDSSWEDPLKDLNLLNELESGYSNGEINDRDPDPELSTPESSASVNTMTIIGEPTEKIFLWGQSACTLNDRKPKQIIVFGGFGGLGRHARRNYSLLLDPHSGQLNEIDAAGPPSPRLGHTSSVLGDQVFFIGGRGGPTQILNDVWVLQMSENRWMSPECSGTMFHPRHRHAAASVGSKIYVFGGLNEDLIYSCMNVLDVDTLQWSRISVQGEWPSARHSHSMIANCSTLFMFGGYDGEKALGDLYSFDPRTCLWKKEKTSGRPPFPRFSHSMFVYKHFLGILGGCPLRQQNQELSLLNTESNIWMHVTVDSLGRDVWVRSSASVIDDDLVIVGGGTSCYAFGTKFNEPMKINLKVINSLCGMTSDKENKPPRELHRAVGNVLHHSNNHLKDRFHSFGSPYLIGVPAEGDVDHIDVLQVEKKYAKLVKDILKKFGWLDLSRKIQPSQDEHIRLPVSRTFCTMYQKQHLSPVDACDDICQQGIFGKKGLSSNEISLPMAMRFLLSCGSSLQVDDTCSTRKISKAPQKIMRESVCSLLREKGMPLKLLEQLPLRWERLGDIVVLPVNCFRDPIWDSIGDELWPIVAKSLGAQRLARQGRILPTGTRDSTLDILVGDGGWVTHQENGIIYSFDATKCMFSSGNLSEKLRMAHLHCNDEIVVDLFAGIGYFVLPFLVKAKAKLVYACEWNPIAIEALKHNLHANSVADRCIVLEGDNRVTAPTGVADRVCLGLLPSSESSWATAVRALRSEGGVLHVHENAVDSEENSWLEYVCRSISSIAQSEGLCWNVAVQHVEHVKWYGPHIRHVVADIRCQQIST